MTQTKFGDAEVTFDITTEGLVKYTSSDTGSSDLGTIVFSVKTLSR